MDYDKLFQTVVNSATLGSTYALIALGYTMVYGILKLLNFAHGDVFMIGAYVGLGVLTAAGGPLDPSFSPWLVLVLMALAAMAACALLGVSIERFAYRPLRDAPRITPLISALGVSFFLSNSAQLLFGAEHRTYDTFNIAGGKLYEPAVTLGSFSISWLRVITVVSAIVLMVVLWYLVTRTRIGKAMRATAIDRDAAAMMGIDIDRVIMFAFLLAGGLAGAAGVLFALRTDLFPQMGFTPGLFAFTAAVIGGIGSIPGAMLGGYLLGTVEALTVTYVTVWVGLPVGLSNFVIFSLLIVFMLFRPQGILGRPEIRKV
ncbi:MAG TPA: branched-chain amino acid ABC transporter permease [Gaiellaceae bacterium]|nr:branched-chain amino acid ABC transporter permease [Gaiellaceae bacterium]